MSKIASKKTKKISKINFANDAIKRHILKYSKHLNANFYCYLSKLAT